MVCSTDKNFSFKKFSFSTCLTPLCFLPEQMLSGTQPFRVDTTSNKYENLIQETEANISLGQLREFHYLFLYTYSVKQGGMVGDMISTYKYLQGNCLNKREGFHLSR